MTNNLSNPASTLWMKMRKIFFKLIFLFLVVGLARLVYPSTTFAQLPFPNCGFRVSSNLPDKQISENRFKRGFDSLTFEFDLSNVTEDEWGYFTDADRNGKLDILDEGLLLEFPLDYQHNKYYSPPIEKNFKKSETLTSLGSLRSSEHNIYLKYKQGLSYYDLCVGSFTIEVDKGADINVESVASDGTTPVPGDTKAYWKISISNVRWDDGLVADWTYTVDLNGNNLNNDYANNLLHARRDLGRTGNWLTQDITFILKPLNADDYIIDVLPFLAVGISTDKKIASRTFAVYPEGQAPSSTPVPSPTVFGAPTSTPTPPIPSLAPICDQLPITNNFRSNCWNCVNTGGIWTAIGCVPTNFDAILNNYVFPIGAGIGGGASFLSFLYGIFLILTSGGNPEKIAEGKEIIISALSGLFLIIFSVFLLRVIGYNILQIPGFG